MRKCVPKSQPPYCVSGGCDLQNLQVCKTYRSLLLQGPGPVRCRAGKSLESVGNAFRIPGDVREGAGTAGVADCVCRHSELNQPVSLGINSSASPVPGPPPSDGTHGTNQESLNDSADGERGRRRAERLEAKGLFCSQSLASSYLPA